MSVSQIAKETAIDIADSSSPVTAASSSGDEDEQQQQQQKSPSAALQAGLNGDENAHLNSADESDAPSPVTVKSDTETAENGGRSGEPTELAVPVSDDEDEEVQQSDEQLTDGQQNTNFESGIIPLAAEEELDEITIAKEISTYIHANRINPVEIESLEDMWAICDAISAAHSGLPDSLLKEAYLLVLEGFYGHSYKNKWLRDHIDVLIKKWKREILSGKSISRPTKFVAASAEYDVSAPNEVTSEGPEIQNGKTKEEDLQSTGSTAKVKRQRRQAARRKRALAAIMGVGQMLEHARKTLTTEEGELDVEEDEYGNFCIGGMELSFENWGQINKIKEDDIVCCMAPPQPKRWKRPPPNGAAPSPSGGGVHVQHSTAPQPPTFGIGTSPPTQTASAGLSMAEQYPTVGEVEMPGLDLAEGRPEEQRKETKAGIRKDKKQQKEPLIVMQEKDEGEISSTDDEPTSSSEESSDNEVIGLQPTKTAKRVVGGTLAMTAANRARDRRQMKREEECRQGASSAQNLQVLLRKCFDLRGKIVRKLTVQQKAMFMDLLKQSLAGTLQRNAQQQQQHQALAQLMSAFAAGR